MNHYLVVVMDDADECGGYEVNVRAVDSFMAWCIGESVIQTVNAQQVDSVVQVLRLED